MRPKRSPRGKPRGLRPLANRVRGPPWHRRRPGFRDGLPPCRRIEYDHRMRQLAALFTSLVVVAAASAADKGLMGPQATNPNGKVMEVTTYYTADKRVIDAPRQRTIVDLSAKTMTMIDKAARSYTVTTFDAMRRRGDGMGQT